MGGVVEEWWMGWRDSAQCLCAPARTASGLELGAWGGHTSSGILRSQIQGTGGPTSLEGTPRPFLSHSDKEASRPLTPGV